MTPVDYQKEQLDKLLEDPTKPVYIPDAPKKKEIAPAKEMFAHVQGSSAGAGSGEFHVYKQSRRREYDRVQLMEEERREEARAAEFEQRRREREAVAEAKTSKNRNRRNKRKQGKQDAKTKESNKEDDTEFKKRKIVGGTLPISEENSEKAPAVPVVEKTETPTVATENPITVVEDSSCRTTSRNYPVEYTEKNSELFLVDSLEGDSPKLWPAWKRWSLTVFVGIIAIASAMASAGTTGVAEDIMAEFDFTDEIEATLCLSVYMLGYVLGPIWGPASEAFGRKYTLIFCLWVLTLFNIADAVSSTPEALYVCRFFAGFFGGCMIIVVGPCIGDMFTAKDKQIALAIYACCPYLGPSIAPIVSGFIHDSGTSWRWMFGVLAIFSGSCAILALFILPETYEPVLLVWKAKKLRKETHDTRYVAPKELQTKGMSGVMNDIFTKPFVMLAYEPMLAALSFYSAFVYGVQYLLFEAFQFVYSAEKGGHDMSNGTLY
ncbi:MFS general substrate transporter [Wallemia mellicola]|nr:MFS general substrate transporter [Wallemia mellicola]